MEWASKVLEQYGLAGLVIAGLVATVGILWSRLSKAQDRERALLERIATMEDKRAEESNKRLEKILGALGERQRSQYPKPDPRVEMPFSTSTRTSRTRG